jgi:hypothetical protein
LRLLSPRARAAVLGSLALSVPAAAPVAAQTPAPAPAAAPVAPAPGAKTASKAKARPALRVTRRALNVRAGRTARVSGTLRPGRYGSVVTLERRSGTRWTTIDKARTTRGGRFTLAYRTRRVDTSTVRVRFAGDRRARPARRTLGRLNVFRPRWRRGTDPACSATRSAAAAGCTRAPSASRTSRCRAARGSPCARATGSCASASSTAGPTSGRASST